MEQQVVFRKGVRVQLRPLERADVPTLRRWLNDPEVTQFLMRVLPLMEKEEEEWLEALHKSTRDIVLGIVGEVSPHGVMCRELIGTIGLHSIDWRNRVATTGTVLGEKRYWGMGYGTEAKMLLLDLGFNTLDLYAVQSRVIAHNDRSVAYSKKCGYREVGRLPRWVRGSDGERYDEVLLAVTQEEWRPLWRAYCERRVETCSA